MRVDINVFVHELFPYILVFSRVVGMMLFLPGFSADYIPQRLRILLCMALTTILVSTLPALPPPELLGINGTYAWTLHVAKEVTLGAFMGLSARLIFLAFEVTGAVAAISSSLASAELFNPALGTQSTVVAGLYSLVGITILFVADLHHLLLGAMVQSFELFPLLGPVPVGDITQHYISMVNQMFNVGVRLAGPVLLVGFIFTLSLAVLNRLMPAVQVFFVGVPAQIFVCLVVIALSISAVGRVFVETVHHWATTGELL